MTIIHEIWTFWLPRTDPRTTTEHQNHPKRSQEPPRTLPRRSKKTSSVLGASQISPKDPLGPPEDPPRTPKDIQRHTEWRPGTSQGAPRTLQAPPSTHQAPPSQDPPSHPQDARGLPKDPRRTTHDLQMDNPSIRPGGMREAIEYIYEGKKLIRRDLR